jgi:hypothetical protein
VVLGSARAALAIGASAAVAVVLGYSDGAARIAAPPEAELRNCRSRAEGRAPIKFEVRAADVQVGPFVLGNVRNSRGVGPTDDPNWTYAAKTPVLLKARSKVILAIAPEATALAALQHKNAWVSAVRFTACLERVRAHAYRGTVGSTTFFPFAIGLRQRRACVPMELWIDGRTAPVRRIVPIGRRGC